MSEGTDWTPFVTGDGEQRGSEGGIVVADETYADACRITLERDCNSRIAAAITCGIYGWMMHTRFFSDLDTARRAYDAMKIDLAGVVDQIPLEDEPDWQRRIPDITRAIEAFATKYP